MALVTDVLSGAVLQPLMDLLPNPDVTVNLLIDLGFSPDPSKKFGPASGQRVEYLERFVMANHTASQSALQVLSHSINYNHFGIWRVFLTFIVGVSSIYEMAPSTSSTYTSLFCTPFYRWTCRLF